MSSRELSTGDAVARIREALDAAATCSGSWGLGGNPSLCRECAGKVKAAGAALAVLAERAERAEQGLQGVLLASTISHAWRIAKDTLAGRSPLGEIVERQHAAEARVVELQEALRAILTASRGPYDGKPRTTGWYFGFRDEAENLARAVVCEHRRPAGAFCPKCDV